MTASGEGAAAVNAAGGRVGGIQTGAGSVMVTLAPEASGPTRSVRELVRVYGSEDLPTIADLDPYRLGSTSSVFGRSGEYGMRDSYVPRTAHHVDTRLAHALTGLRLVVVVGPSKAGKTRTLFEAVRAHDPGARVVWPTHDGVSELAAHPWIATSTDPLVVWFDDLHEYLTGTIGLTPAVLARFSARPGPTMVVATLRSEMRAQLRGGGELGQDTRMLLEQAVTIDLASTSADADERAAADRAYPGYGGDRYGLGEGLAGAPELLARYDDARAADPALYTVVAVAVDWARVGRTDPIPEPVLANLALRELRTTHAHLDATTSDLRAAIETARTPPPGAGRTAALHTSFLDDDTRGYRAFDYLTAADDGQDHRTPRPIPDTFWHDATNDCDTSTLIGVGVAAYRRDDIPTATTLFRKAAEAGNSRAMHNLGVLLDRCGDLVGAESWYRKATKAGDKAALHNLGLLLRQRGDLGEAEFWYRKAVEAGDRGAMNSLGALLGERGDQGEAESWYRKAIEAGNSEAMYNLGLLLGERGDLDGAESWFRKAVEAGDRDAMAKLGALLGKRGDLDGAESWFRKAVEAGDRDAMNNLGALLGKRGDLVGAESWFRKAAEAGDRDAIFALGVLHAERGDLVGAESWFRKAVEAGDRDAIFALGVLHAERGDLVGAESWFRKAAEAGSSDAMFALGVLLSERGDLVGAESWYRTAIEAGNNSAMNNLGVLLSEHGDLVEAESWLRKAAEAGNSDAMNNLSALLDQQDGE
ncbi:tetratricopeptide repeat protein [Nocardia asteroides]|uniref:tetratricopeptide repeat protein n=1 Tax=Nocardia asteroides TaxID=1824 RepID=UPI0037B68D2C